MHLMPRNYQTTRGWWVIWVVLLTVGGCFVQGDAAAINPPAQGMDVPHNSGGVVTYTYDGSGKRVEKTFTPSSAGVRAVYSVGPHLDVVEREDGSLVMERYITIEGERAAYIPDEAGGEVYAMHNDYLGSPRWMTDSSGSLVRHMRYEPFGRSIDGTKPVLRYRHAGEEVSERLTHLGGIRQYDNAIGRMMQPDAVVPDPTNLQSLNRYSYVYNEPLGYTDTSGYAPVDLGASQHSSHIRPGRERSLEEIRQDVFNFEEYRTEYELDLVSPELASQFAKITETIPIEGVAVVAAVAAKATTKATAKFGGKVAIKSGTRSLKDQAADLIPKNANKNRVTLRSPSQKMEVDLAGRTHGDIPTPHTKVSPRNLQAPKQPAYNTKNSPVRPATQQDIRTVRRYLERQGR